MISTGSRSHKPTELHPGNVPITFIKNKVIDSKQLSSMLDLPKSVILIGGGVIAVEYATVWADVSVCGTMINFEESFFLFVEKELKR